MTTPVRPTHTEQIAASHRHQEDQRWQAAQTVRLHVSPQEQHEMLDCLGLLDLVPPQDRQA